MGTKPSIRSTLTLSWLLGALDDALWIVIRLPFGVEHLSTSGCISQSRGQSSSHNLRLPYHCSTFSSLASPMLRVRYLSIPGRRKFPALFVFFPKNDLVNGLPGPRLGILISIS
jgi:hypothetical protein